MRTGSDEWEEQLEVGDETNSSIMIGWADDATLHACLGVAGAPVPQGGSAAASGVALRAWFSGLVVAVNVDSPVMLAEGIPSSEFFHHLSFVEYGDVVQALLDRSTMLTWGPALAAVGLSAGRFYMVTASGRGGIHAMHQRLVPFL